MSSQGPPFKRTLISSSMIWRQPGWAKTPSSDFHTKDMYKRVEIIYGNLKEYNEERGYR